MLLSGLNGLTPSPAFLALVAVPVPLFFNRVLTY